jgi:hypothetical protein
MSNNPKNLSFPYPLLGKEIRPQGQGCIVCVHKMYCPAVYWFKRYGFTDLTSDNGRSCDSWSDNPDDKVTTITESDIEANNYIYLQGIGSESDRNGLTSPTTGSSRGY